MVRRFFNESASIGSRKFKIRGAAQIFMGPSQEPADAGPIEKGTIRLTRELQCP
jgi:hypothetical protein